MLKKLRKLRTHPRQFFEDFYDKRVPLHLRVRLCIDSTDIELRDGKAIVTHPLVVEKLRERMSQGRSRIVIGWW
jgi:hypothetical protein